MKFMDSAKQIALESKALAVKRSNPWQAPPMTHYETVFIKKEKTISDLNPNQLRV